MQSQEQQLIESLFGRLKQAESQSAARDSNAEQIIQQQIRQQPAAPYYMAQTILIQEAALKQLNARISELETRLTQTQQRPQQQNSGGFLADLFGGGNHSQQQQPPAASPAWGAPQQQSPAAAPSAGRGFLGGALQTAAGVAGGVVLADMLTSMFHHSQPQEIVNIINEPAMPEPDLSNNLDTFNAGDNSSLLDQGSVQQDFVNDSSNDAFANDGFDDNDFDDDSFV